MSAGQPDMPAGFTITVIDADGGGTQPRVVVTGELDLLTSTELQEALTGVIEQQRPATMLADLTGVTFFDSSALNVLLQVQRQAEQQQVTLAVAPSRQVRRVLELSGTIGHLKLDT
jgi:anti-sigma B factor antagonist